MMFRTSGSTGFSNQNNTGTLAPITGEITLKKQGAGVTTLTATILNQDSNKIVSRGHRLEKQVKQQNNTYEDVPAH